ncbi:MAG: GNAT family N-acetyltransferase [Pseudomonadota bacterium]
MNDVTKIEVTVASPGHGCILGALHKSCFGTNSWPVGDIQQLLQQPFTVAWLAALDAHPVGFAMVRRAADEAEVLTICTDRDHRRKGVGRQLLAAIEQWSCANHVHALFLEASIQNEAACSLYRDVGFEQVGRRRGYYGNGADAHIFARRIP